MNKFKEDSEEKLQNPIPPAVKLKHLDDIRKEQALVYRQAKYGKIALNKGKELSLMLRKLAETVNEIEAYGNQNNKENWTQSVTIYGMPKDAI